MTDGDFGAWFDVYERVACGEVPVDDARCPRCGAVSVRLAFVVPAPGSPRGAASFWCDSCLHGLPLLRALRTPVLDELTVVRGDERVPSYRLVVEPS